MKDFILLLCLTGLTASQRCPNGWDYFQDSCYKFPNVLATWGTALDICLQMNSYLVEIGTPEENKFIETHNLKWHNFWTGGNDIEIEAEWKWITSGKRFNFTNWDVQDRHNIQPNNLNHREDCMLIYHVHHQWHDAHCGDKNFFICEQEAAELPPTEPTFPTTTAHATSTENMLEQTTGTRAIMLTFPFPNIRTSKKIMEMTTPGPFIIG